MCSTQCEKPLKGLSAAVPRMGTADASDVCLTADVTDVTKLKYCYIISKLAKEDMLEKICNL